MSTQEPIKLTQFSRGAGCGCKIAPAVLQEIIKSDSPVFSDQKLLVGNSSNDDAAVYDLGNDQLLIATTDFFMPIVDDAYDFGCIAAANAISDVYAMGGKPILALAILGWPIDKIPAAEAQRALDGARSVCTKAGIALAGGHSIDSAEPFLGLAVNGIVGKKQLKQNNTAKAGDVLFLTAPLGTGILATAQKRALIAQEHYSQLLTHLTRVNTIGAQLSACEGINAMTDVTGFGLAGHLTEMAQGSGLSAEINYSALRLLDGVKGYLAQRSIPDATYRNWNAYSNGIQFADDVDIMEAFSLLPDPQTNGGLLIAVSPDRVDEVQTILKENGFSGYCTPIGKMIEKNDKVIWVNK